MAKKEKSFGRKLAETAATATVGSIVAGTVGTILFGPAGGLIGVKIGAAIGAGKGMANSNSGGNESIESYDHINSGLDQPGGYFGDISNWIG